MPHRIAIDLDDELAARFETAAEQTEALAAAAIARAVNDLEERIDDEAAYAEYERTGEAIPIDSMQTWVRSWGKPDELPPPKSEPQR